MKLKNNLTALLSLLHRIPTVALGSFLSVLVLTSTGCDKALDSITDCAGESLLISVHYEANDANPRIVDFEIHYSGEFSVTSVAWNFGDGNNQTVKTLEVEHTYATAGTYEITAEVNLKKGGKSCQVKPKETVVVD